MKLSFDQNLSPKLASSLGHIFPGSSHVVHEGLETASDEEVWQHAKRAGFTIVSKDADFANLSVMRGSPPQPLWLLLGNCTTMQVEQALRELREEIESFGQDMAIGTLTIS